MNYKNGWLKYCSPLVGLLSCPITILFLWTIWSDPIVNTQPDFIEEEQT